VILREVVGGRTLPREPEPDLVMADADQVTAYTEAGRIDGVMSAAYLFHSARMTQVLQGCKRVIDLGCGPATQLAQVAELNPDIAFLGLELSAEMLRQAKQHVQELGLKNVDFVQGDMTDLGQVQSDSMDGVISTMALHHLPSEAHLEKCFGEIRRVLRLNGALYLADFGRMKSLRSVIYFAYMNAQHQPHIFSLDYERSLRAAFLPEEIARLAGEKLGAAYTVDSTFPVPILVLIKSADRPVTATQRQRFETMREKLPNRYRGDLDLIRRLFRMGGLKNDPFG
jgi:arsenite methyltransferase